MSDMSGKYKQIIKELEENIKDEKELEFVKEKFSDMSMLFMDMLERVTRLTDSKIQELEQKQHDILNKINSVQSAVNGIESDIYEDEENYEFEIVCPYCNYEFAADIEDESKEEIICPECHNTIELDWNPEEEIGGCSGSCSHCHTECVAENEEEYHLEAEEDEEELENEEEPNDEDM